MSRDLPQEKAYRSKRGFTLIEVMVVTIIMGVLATIAVPNVFGVIERARERIDLLKLFYLKDAINRALVEDEAALYNSAYLSEGSEKDQKDRKIFITSPIHLLIEPKLELLQQ